jgi:hypothetical protein
MSNQLPAIKDSIQFIARETRRQFTFFNTTKPGLFIEPLRSSELLHSAEVYGIGSQRGCNIGDRLQQLRCHSVAWPAKTTIDEHGLQHAMPGINYYTHSTHNLLPAQRYNITAVAPIEYLADLYICSGEDGNFKLFVDPVHHFIYTWLMIGMVGQYFNIGVVHGKGCKYRYLRIGMQPV